MLHGREGEERKRDHRHMWTGPSRGNSVVAGDDVVSDSFFKDGRKISVGDCALFKPPQDSPPFIGIIRWLTTSKENKLKLGVNWLYRRSEVKLGKAILLEAAPNEIFYSFHKDEIPAASLLHPCKVAFLPKGVELPSGICSFVCRRVYDITNKCLWWLTDQDYINERQEEVDYLLNKTRLEMHVTVQPGGRSPKPVNGPTSTSQLKPGSDSVQNSVSSFPSQGKGKKRERADQGSEPVKRERFTKMDDGDSGHSRPESMWKSEISKFTDRGGLVDSEGVEKLVRLMMPERNEKKIDLVGRSILAGVVAATDKFDCLNRFVQLRGLPVFDEWLQEVHKGKNGDGSSPKDGDKSAEEFLLVLLRALDKLPVNLHALQMCNIGKSVNNLRTHKNLEIQKKARSLVDTWKKRVEAEMDANAKSGSNQGVSWTARSRLPEISHGGNRQFGVASEVAMKSTVVQLSASKTGSVKVVQGETVARSASTSPGPIRSTTPPGSAGNNSKEAHLRNTGASGASDPSVVVARDEKSSSSSQSHNNSQSCSSDHAKNGGVSGKEDARSSTAGSMMVNKVVGGSLRHRKSGNGFPGQAMSSVQKETGSSRNSTLHKNLGSEKLSQSSLTCEKALDVPVAEGNGHKFIVKIPNRGRSPAQSASGGSLEDLSVMNSRASSPVLSEKHDHFDRNLKEKNDACRAGEGKKSMGGSDGILGMKGGERNSSEKWVKRRERWLVILGIVLHAVYMLSIFDIYFKTPIVHGMHPVKPRFKDPPAKRLVLLVADGLRADKFFEPDSEGNHRAPFLRNIIKNRGRWGVSHARPPTESRPGHVSIIAGFYEDPSAVTKGWKANPVEFDSVFNQSRHTFAYGSPDIVPIFCGALPHSTWKTYPHEFEDFATDASFLDEWSFDQFQSLLNRSNEDPELKELLLQDNLVIFLHLLGCDSNGHAHRPFSSIYLNNVKVVDHIAERVYSLLEHYYKDNRTSYVFTADHGMSDKGSHGDGHPSNTDTPLVVWGAGVKYPKPISSSNNSDHGVFVDEHAHDMPTPVDWGLNGIERVDVNQADIAPLMSTLLGLPCPVNSVGNLPLGYVDMIEDEEVEAVLANTKQILNQFLCKSKIKQSNSLYFKPFKLLAHHSAALEHIEHLISIRDYGSAMMLAQNLRTLALKGLQYFQTYDWLMLMTVITLGYIGWIICLLLHILQSYTSLADVCKNPHDAWQRNNKTKVYLFGCLLTGAISVLLFMEHSPPLYHAYFSMTVFLWTQIVGEYQFIKTLCRWLSWGKYNYIIKILAASAVSIFILEFLVNSFTERKLYTWCFFIMGIIAAFYLFHAIPWRSGIPIYVCCACWFLSVFTLMPADIPDNNGLVIASGAIIVIIGAAARWLDQHSEGNKYWLRICYHKMEKPRSPALFFLQVLLVGLSSVMVSLSTSHRKEKQELHAIHQLINWSIAGFSMVLPLFSEKSLLSRLTSIFLGFAPTFLLLSIGYEAVFYGALALVLVAWILFENTILHLTKVSKLSASMKRTSEKTMLENDVRYLQLSDVRIPLIFLILFNVAFFGTGNFASIASFEISSVYRFITVFSPFLMATLLIFKLFIPFMLVICVFSAITKLLQVPRVGCYFLVILFSDVMTIHFFFLVRNTGSWMEIGNSISHFGIVSAQVVFVLLLFALTNTYTKDIQIGSAGSSSQKAA